MDRPLRNRWPRPELEEHMLDILVEKFLPPSAAVLASEAAEEGRRLQQLVSKSAWSQALDWEAKIMARADEVAGASMQVAYLLGLAAGAALYCQTEEAEARLVGERVAAAVLLGPQASYSASEAGDRAAGAMRAVSGRDLRPDSE